MGKLTPLQRDCMVAIYTPNYGYDGAEYDKQIKALCRKGFVTLADPEDLQTASVTHAGLVALGLSQRHPDNLKAAFLDAATVFLPHLECLDEPVEFGDDIAAVCASEDWEHGSSSWTNTTIALAAVMDSFADLTEIEILWDCVARRVTECGYPCFFEYVAGKAMLIRQDAA